MRFNEKKFAFEYEKRLLDEGYPGKLLNDIKNELSGSKTLIDIGAGTGFFTIPLANLGYVVTAVEPSEEMIKILNTKLSDDSKKNVSIVKEEWENYNGKTMDSAICIHSIYPMKQPQKAILNMLKYAKKRILLVKKSGTRTLTGEIRNHLGLVKKTLDYNNLIIQTLEKNNVRFKYREIIQERNVYFDNIDKKADYYCYYLKLNDSNKPTIKVILLKISEKKDNKYRFKSKYCDNLYVF